MSEESTSSERVEKEKTGRRKVMKMIGVVGATGVSNSILPVGATETQQQNDKTTLNQLQEKLTEQYNKKEANIVRGIVEDELDEYERGNKTAEEAYDSATERILRSPHTPEISKSLEEHIEATKEHRKRIRYSSRKLTDSKSLDSVSPDATSITIFDGEDWKNSSILGDIDTNWSVSDEIIEQYTRATGYGSANSEVRIWGLYNPLSQGGNYQIEADYWRRGSEKSISGTVDTSINIFVRDEDGNTFRETVENSGWGPGDTKRSAQFFLSSNTLYDVGIEIAADVTSIGPDFSGSDFQYGSLTRNRKVDLNGIKIEYLG